ncbi:MAG TPA: hypothetical protein VGI61_12215 [Parafilimonas sp.]
MKTTAIDEEMSNYIMQLSEAEKKSILQLIKTFLQSRKHSLSIEEYNTEIEESEKEIEKGEFHTQEEVVKMSSQWLHDK